MEEMTRVHVIISGKVQGVYFRMETRRAAEKYGVAGWVRNRADGTVEAVFEAETSRVHQLLEWCRKGPPSARVDQVSPEPERYTGQLKGFSIMY
ncbi:MAG: acylphosphatase [Desulfobacterales bacterium]|nr:acylphosphatase [Desulfobacterales bacterium]